MCYLYLWRLRILSDGNMEHTAYWASLCACLQPQKKPFAKCIAGDKSICLRDSNHALAQFRQCCDTSVTINRNSQLLRCKSLHLGHKIDYLNWIQQLHIDQLAKDLRFVAWGCASLLAHPAAQPLGLQRGTYRYMCILCRKDALSSEGIVSLAHWLGTRSTIINLHVGTQLNVELLPQFT
jgi:hypothetical protein